MGLRDSIVMKSRIKNFGLNDQLKKQYPNTQILLWTEDSWRLIGAKAVSYNPQLNYVVVQHGDQHFMLAEKRLGEFVARIGSGKASIFNTMLVMSGDQMQGITVINPVTGLELPLVAVDTLKPTHGSGLHSISPAHSIEDLRLSYMYNLARDGVLCSQTGYIVTKDVQELRGLSPDDEKILPYFKNHKSYFCSWKH